jgi:hypothetical protein
MPRSMNEIHGGAPFDGLDVRTPVSSGETVDRQFLHSEAAGVQQMKSRLINRIKRTQQMKAEQPFAVNDIDSTEAR